jgi:small subunit ribosomal protein S21
MSQVAVYVVDACFGTFRESSYEKGGGFRVPTVVLRPGESQESLLRRFRKQVTKARILSTVKKKRYFVSKSEQRRRARLKAIRREKKRQRRENRRYRR